LFHSKVVEFLQPNELKKVLDTTLYDGPTDNEELVKLLNQATKHFIKTGLLLTRYSQPLKKG